MPGEQKYQLLFRGDSRRPEKIFKEGFTPLKPQAEDKELPFRLFNPSYSPECVSLTSDFDTATIFPCDGPNRTNEKTWVYVIAQDVTPDARKYINLREKSLSEAKELDCILFVSEWANEHIVSQVPSSHILCAFPIERTKITKDVNPLTPSFTHDKTLDEPIQNPEAKQLLAENAYAKEIYTAMLTRMQSQKEKVLPNSMANIVNLKRDQLQSAYFITNKLPTELTATPYKSPKLKKSLNKAFFENAGLQNPAGILTSSKEQLYKMNTLFFSQVKKGVFDKEILADTPKLLDIIDTSITFFCH